MFDNKLFMLYLKYMLTKFNTEKKSKIFCLMIKNMEQQIAKKYKYKNCIIILNEHRSFSISVIRNGKRIINNQNLMAKFIACVPNSNSKNKNDCFPNKNGYFHYRDDYDSSFFIANVSNFDFFSSVNDKTNILNEKYSEHKQKSEAMPDLERYHPYANANQFSYINKSTTAPEPMVSNTDEKQDEKINDFYYKIGQKNETLFNKMNEKMNEIHKKDYLNKYELDLDLVNDIYVGPNKGDDIAQNDDFAHLINRYGSYNQNQNKEKITRDHSFYSQNNAPFNNTLCYSPFDLILAVNDVVINCENENVFENEIENENEIPIILIGSLTNLYGDFIQQFCQLINEENNQNNNFKLKYIAEYVKNEGTKDIENRSSVLKQLLQSVVTPKEISNFISISDVKNKITIQTNKNEKQNQIAKDKQNISNEKQNQIANDTQNISNNKNKNKNKNTNNDKKDTKKASKKKSSKITNFLKRFQK